jgi:hypothetical protein
MSTSGLPVRPVTAIVATEPVEPLAWLPMRQPRVLPAPLRGVAREVLAGLVTPAAAAASTRQRALVAQLRRGRRRPGSAVVVAGSGGAGATSVAAGVALMLAALRPGSTALVDVQAGTLPLRPRLTGHTGLRVVDGVPWHQAVHPGDLRRLLDRATAANGFVVVDAGDETGPAPEAAIRYAGRVLVATAGGADAGELVGAALSRVRRIAPQVADDAIVAVVCRRRRGLRRAIAALRRHVPTCRVVPVPYDRWLAAGWPPAGDRWRPAVRDAYLALAGLATGAAQTLDAKGT